LTPGCCPNPLQSEYICEDWKTGRHVTAGRHCTDAPSWTGCNAMKTGRIPDGGTSGLQVGLPADPLGDTPAIPAIAANINSRTVERHPIQKNHLVAYELLLFATHVWCRVLTRRRRTGARTMSWQHAVCGSARRQEGVSEARAVSGRQGLPIPRFTDRTHGAAGRPGFTAGPAKERAEWLSRS